MNKNAANIKFATMPTRFLPTHGLTHEKSGLARQQIFFRYKQLKPTITQHEKNYTTTIKLLAKPFLAKPFANAHSKSKAAHTGKRTTKGFLALAFCRRALLQPVLR